MRKIFTFLLLALFSATMFAQEEHTYTVVGGSAALFTESWNPALAVNDLTKVEEGIYTITFENKALIAGNIEYKIVQDHSWAVSYPQVGNTSFNIPETGNYDVTFTLDLSKETPYSVVATKKGEAVIDDVAQLAGTFNDWTKADMTLSGDKSKASITLDLAKGSYDFKVVINDGWHGDGHAFTRENNTLEGLELNTADMSITTDVKGEYTFTWTFATKTLVITYPALPKFYITGSESLVGEELAWKGDAVLATEDSYTFKNLAAGKYQLKVVSMEGDWLGIDAMSEVAGGLYRDQDKNVCFILDEVGDVTVTYKEGESPVFTLAGAFVAPEIKLIGINGWNEDTDAIEFTAAPDGKSASKTLNLTGEWYDFKLIRAGEWLGKTNEGTENFRIHRGNNWVDALVRDYVGLKSVSLQPDKKGDFTFTYDFALGKLTVSFPELANSAVTIAAPAHGSISVLKGEEAVASGDKVEELTTLTISLSDNTEGYIFSNLRAFKTGEPETTVAITDGKLTMPEFAITITADEDARKLANGFYLVGTFGGVNAWGIDDLTEDKKFYVNPNNEEEYMLIIDLGIADEFKVFEVRDDAFVGYYPDGSDNNYIVDADHAGKNKYIYFDTDEHDGWHHGHIFVPDNATTAIDNTNVDANVMKRIENGQLIIIKNGVRYNAQGAVVE